MTVYVVDPKSYADVETDIENIGMLAGTLRARPRRSPTP